MKVTVNMARLSYPALFEPRLQYKSTVKKYQATLIIPKSDANGVKAVQDAIQAVLHNPETLKDWGGDVTVGSWWNPLRDGDKAQHADLAYKNAWFIRAKSGENKPPEVIMRDKSKCTDPKQFYGGCWVQAVLWLYSYSVGVNKGIAATLIGIRKMKDDTPFNRVTLSDSDWR